jgi:iron complex outermembrane receptor protein
MKVVVSSSQVSVTAVLVAGLVLAEKSPAHAQSSPQELKQMTIEELLALTVTTVSRGPEVARQVPAALHVITREDIRRAGVSTIAAALRLAPGLHVARINAGTWAIGTRGFTDRLSRSMLVLIDGREVYSPLFAGTYWEVQDTLLEDIDRIEVIRGPGGTLWGANAVNGIVNIITRNARDTAGLFVRAGVGSSETGPIGVRYGSPVGDTWHYRAYAKAVDRRSQHHAADASYPDYDRLTMVQGGVRADWASRGRSATIQGDVYGGTLGQLPTVTTYSPPYTTTEAIDAPLAGGNVLARWNSAPGGRAEIQVQGAYTRTHRDERPVAETRDTVEVGMQMTLQPWQRHRLMWGTEYRLTSGAITAVAPTAFLPPRRTDQLFAAFVQDDIAFAPDWLRATVGTKIEHNDYSGVELQPSVRLAWTPSPVQTIWSAVTRAVRTPSRVEKDYTTVSLLNPAIPFFVRLEPNPDFNSEQLIAYELGYRVQPVLPVHLTAAAFYNDHDDTLSTEIFSPQVDPPAAPVRLIVPVTFANGLKGNSYGVEFTADVRPAAWWRLTGHYSYLRLEFSRKPGSRDGSQQARYEGSSPRHQSYVRASFDLPRQWTIDTAVRAVGELPFLAIPAYVTADARVAWRSTTGVELAVVGSDLGQPHHVEWPSGTRNIAIYRSISVELTWRR